MQTVRCGRRYYLSKLSKFSTLKSGLWKLRKFYSIHYQPLHNLKSRWLERHYHHFAAVLYSKLWRIFSNRTISQAFNDWTISHVFSDWTIFLLVQWLDNITHVQWLENITRNQWLENIPRAHWLDNITPIQWLDNVITCSVKHITQLEYNKGIFRRRFFGKLEVTARNMMFDVNHV